MFRAGGRFDLDSVVHQRPDKSKLIFDYVGLMADVDESTTRYLEIGLIALIEELEARVQVKSDDRFTRAAFAIMSPARDPTGRVIP